MAKTIKCGPHSQHHARTDQAWQNARAPTECIRKRFAFSRVGILDRAAFIARRGTEVQWVALWVAALPLGAVRRKDLKEVPAGRQTIYMRLAGGLTPLTKANVASPHVGGVYSLTCALRRLQKGRI